MCLFVSSFLFCVYLCMFCAGCLLRVSPSASAAFSCGTQDLGFYPHPTSCTQFLGCVYGQQYTMHCPSGLNFNPTLHLCDWPDNAGCVVPPAPQTQISPCTGCKSHPHTCSHARSPGVRSSAREGILLNVMLCGNIQSACKSFCSAGIMGNVYCHVAELIISPPLLCELLDESQGDESQAHLTEADTVCLCVTRSPLCAASDKVCRLLSSTPFFPGVMRGVRGQSLRE